jgi:eukaryotic-like serine/threonine-protein kinase
VLGQGGMGVVWKARVPGPVPTYVALKCLHEESSLNAEMHGALLDEARVLVRIRSPHVAQVLEVFEENESVVVVLEWVNGISLAQAISTYANASGLGLPLPLSLRIIADACAGLHAAHEVTGEEGQSLGLVHRDVSPQNILIDRSGVTKLIDFGIAKTQGRTSKDTTSAVKGKLAYMSREQAAKEPLDRRADVFSMGVVLYELLTGAHPFSDETDLDLLRALHNRVPMKPLPSTVPSGVATILRRALAHERSDRFATALALRNELESAMQDYDLGLDAPGVAKQVSAWVDAEDAVRADAQTRQSLLRSGQKRAESHMPHRRTLRLILASGFGAVLLVLAALPPKGFSRSETVVRTRTRVASTAAAIVAPAAHPTIEVLRAPLLGSARMKVRAIPTAAVAPTPSPKEITVPTASAPAPSCDPPWTIDVAGVRRYRPECL